MRYYIIYPLDDKHHDTCIMKYPRNIAKRGPESKKFKGTPYANAVKPLGKTEEEMWLRWILDDYPINTLLVNDNVRTLEDLPKYREGWYKFVGQYYK